jgi:hypothetical protein
MKITRNTPNNSNDFVCVREMFRIREVFRVISWIVPFGCDQSTLRNLPIHYDLLARGKGTPIKKAEGVGEAVTKQVPYFAY